MKLSRGKLVGTLLVWVLAIVLCRGRFDIAVAEWAHAREHTALKTVSDSVGKLGLSTWWLVGSVLLWFAGRNLVKRPLLAEKAKLVFLALIVSGLISIAAKLVFGEARPREYFDGGAYGFHWFVSPRAHHMQGFPSGHTTTVFALGTSFALLWPRCWSLALAVAVTVGMSRIGNAYHFPSDVLAGALLGTSVAYFLYRRMQAGKKGLAKPSEAGNHTPPATSRGEA